MKKLIVSSVLAFITFSAQAAAFQVTSNEIKTGEQLTTSHVFSGFGCEGGNTSPSLTWSGAPEGTKSFAVTVYDPDAPTGSGWWHWTVANIPATVTYLPTDAGRRDGTNFRLVLFKAEMILVMQDLVEHVLPKEINPIITSLKYGL